MRSGPPRGRPDSLSGLGPLFSAAALDSHNPSDEEISILLQHVLIEFKCDASVSCPLRRLVKVFVCFSGRRLVERRGADVRTFDWCFSVHCRGRKEHSAGDLEVILSPPSRVGVSSDDGSNESDCLSRRILKVNPPMPPGLSPEVSDFISKLLVKDPRKRLGGGEDDAEELKRHSFFAVSCHLPALSRNRR